MQATKARVAPHPATVVAPENVNVALAPEDENVSDCWGTIVVASLNMHGQSKLPHSKQCQIEDFLKHEHIDILHCQEINIKEDSFKTCKYINSQYNLITNNALNEYGTSSFVKTDIETSDHKCDTEGRALVFSIGDLSLANVYQKSGTDNLSRNQREHYCSEMIPQLLLNSKDCGTISGDWNCIKTQ